MSDSESGEYRHRLGALLKQQEAAKGVVRDRWNLPPVRKGWRRGQVRNLRHSQKPCPMGMLLVMDFDLVEQPDQPDQPGIAVRMNGTSFNTALFDGFIADIPDPSPHQRPLTPIEIGLPLFGDHLHAYYPGRDDPPSHRLLAHALLAIGGPAVALVAILALLHFWAHIF